MKILKTTPFTSPVHITPGDKLRVTWWDREGNEVRKVAETEVKITESRILDTAVLVDFPSEEAKAFGLKSALGCLAGESLGGTPELPTEPTRDHYSRELTIGPEN